MICVCINMSIGCYWCQALHLVLPFWFLLTRVVPDKFQKSSKTVVCVCVCEVHTGQRLSAAYEMSHFRIGMLVTGNVLSVNQMFLIANQLRWIKASNLKIAITFVCIYCTSMSVTLLNRYANYKYCYHQFYTVNQVRMKKNDN